MALDLQPKVKNRVIPALLLVQVLFGLWHVVGSAVLDHLSPTALIGFRVYLSIPILLLMAGVWKRPLPTKRDVLHLMALGAIIIPGNQILYAEGLFRAGPINASVLLMLAPVFTLALALILKHEKFSWQGSLGIALAFIGALGLAELDQFALAPETTTGNLLLMAAALCYAFYLVMAKGAFQRVGFLPGVAWVFLAGGIWASPWTVPAVMEVPWTELPPEVIAMLTFVILGPTLGTYGLNAYALEKAPSSLVGVFITLQPVIAITLAGTLLDMELKVSTLLWGLPVLAGVILSSLSPSRMTQPESPSEPADSVETSV
jgi:drug/metabolite transporter (DMT)-like permease